MTVMTKQLTAADIMESYRKLSEVERKAVDALAKILVAAVKDRRPYLPAAFSKWQAIELLGKIGALLNEYEQCAGEPAHVE